MHTFRKQVLSLFSAMVGSRISALQHALDELQDSLTGETKSTAGDKYETARAMLHIEQDNVRRQLLVLQEQKARLDSIPEDVAGIAVQEGSMVRTTTGWYLLGPALGKLQAEDQTVFALSVQSPLGNRLQGRTQGDVVTLNGKAVTILSIA